MVFSYDALELRGKGRGSEFVGGGGEKRRREGESFSFY